MDQTPLRLVRPQQVSPSANGSRIVLLHPDAGPTFIPAQQYASRLQQPQTSAVPSSSTTVQPAPPQTSDMIPPNHLLYVDVSALKARQKLIQSKTKPDKSKKPKKKKSTKCNPKQATFILPNDIKMMVKHKLTKPPRKRAPLLLSSAIKALTVSLLKSAADKAIENGSNIVTMDYLEDASLIVAESI